MRHRTRDHPDYEFKQYMRECKKCHKIYYTPARYSKVCTDCVETKQ